MNELLEWIEYTKENTERFLDVVLNQPMRYRISRIFLFMRLSRKYIAPICTSARRSAIINKLKDMTTRKVYRAFTES